jgi:DDE superfamily endonuclease
MPELLWRYLTALLYDRTSASGVAWAETLQTVPHDRLTTVLQAAWSGHTRLESAVRTRFVWQRGDLIIDATVLPKPFATAMEGSAWVCSTQERRPVCGFSRVQLVWTDGQLRAPLGLRLWHRGCPSEYVLALELLSDARHRLRCRPECVLLDAWYPSQALLKRMRGYGGYVVCRLEKNHRVNGQPLRACRRHPYGVRRGWLTGGVTVLVVRYGPSMLPPIASAGRLQRSVASIVSAPKRKNRTKGRKLFSVSYENTEKSRFHPHRSIP